MMICSRVVTEVSRLLVIWQFNKRKRMISVCAVPLSYGSYFNDNGPLDKMKYYIMYLTMHLRMVY